MPFVVLPGKVTSPRLPRPPPPCLGRGLLAIQVRRGDFTWGFCTKKTRERLEGHDCNPSLDTIARRVATEIGPRAHFHTVFVLTEDASDFRALKPLVEKAVNTARKDRKMNVDPIRVVQFAEEEGSGWLTAEEKDGAAQPRPAARALKSSPARAKTPKAAAKPTKPESAPPNGKMSSDATLLSVNQRLLIEMAIAEHAEAFIAHPGSSIGFFIAEHRKYHGELETGMW